MFLIMKRRIKLFLDINNPKLLDNVEKIEKLKEELVRRGLGTIEDTFEIVFDNENEQEVFDLVDKIMQIETRTNKWEQLNNY